MKADQLPVPPRPPIDHDADAEPATDIELLGAMLTDNATTGALLRQLPYERTHYRSNLRMVLGAAVRMKERCIRLLREDDARLPDVLLPAAESVRDAMSRIRYAGDYPDGKLPDPPTQVDTEYPTTPGEAFIASCGPLVEPSKIIDATQNLSSEDTVQRAAAAVRGVNGKTKARRDGHEYTIIESFIMSELKHRGTATTAELVDFVVNDRLVPRTAVDDALANLRRLKRITTARLGRGLINRIAE